MLNHNMLRGPHGYAIIDTISQHQTLAVLEISNNFLGQMGQPGHPNQCLEPPVVLLSRMLIQSRLLERMDLGYN